MRLDYTIDVGNILTSVTIAASVVALLFNWSKDRRNRQREVADRIRAAAARTLAKLERWQEVAAFLYSDVQPLLIDASERLSGEYTPEQARDFLWRRLTETRVVTGQRFLDEDLEGAYVDLYAYNSGTYEKFVKTMKRLRQIDEEVFRRFLDTVQENVMSYRELEETYKTVLLGNDLRRTCEAHRAMLVSETEAILSPIHLFLVTIVSLGDQEVLDRSRQDA